MLLRIAIQWICEAIRLVTERFIGSFPNFSNWAKSNDKIVLKNTTPKKRSPVTIFRYTELNTVLKSSPISWVDRLDIERFSNSKIDFIDMLWRCNVHLSIYDLWIHLDYVFVYHFLNMIKVRQTHPHWLHRSQGDPTSSQEPIWERHIIWYHKSILIKVKSL